MRVPGLFAAGAVRAPGLFADSAVPFACFEPCFNPLAVDFLRSSLEDAYSLVSDAVNDFVTDCIQGTVAGGTFRVSAPVKSGWANHAATTGA
eukprot:365768-Chlamydomonas_euryale.AAC.1